MNAENDFIPLEVIHPGVILAEELKARQIRQRDFARKLDMTTGYLRWLLKGKIGITERTAMMIERELGIPAADWMKMQEHYDKYSGYGLDEMIKVSLKSLYSQYEGLAIEEVVHIELKRHGYTEDDLTEDQMERFKEEMRFRMDGGLMLDGVLTELSPYSPAQLAKMIKQRLEEIEQNNTSI